MYQIEKSLEKRSLSMNFRMIAVDFRMIAVDFRIIAVDCLILCSLRCQKGLLLCLCQNRTANMIVDSGQGMLTFTSASFFQESESESLLQ